MERILIITILHFPVNGGWSQWSLLILTLHTSFSSKRRMVSVERILIIIILLFSVNGGWSQWSGFCGCTRSCGGGVKIRSRKCNSPAPNSCGSTCPGKAVEQVPCNTQACGGELFFRELFNYMKFEFFYKIENVVFI